MDKLYLGVAREIITPEVGGQLFGYAPDVFSERVEDDLTATAFYFKQGDLQALMISVTVAIIKNELAERIIGLISEKFGISKETCMVCATHTHSGPNTAGTFGWGDIDTEYCEGILIPQILKAVEKATAETQPVKMGVARGNSSIGINRRVISEGNNIGLGQNPWGCFDPKMTVISFINGEEKPVANIVHYGMHGTAAGRNHEITRDWSGIMIDTLEKQSGAITAFFNGPEGDVGPRLSNKLTGGSLKYVREIGGAAALDAVRIYDSLFDYHDVELSLSNKKLKIPLKKRMDYAKAKEMLEEYKGQGVNYLGWIRKHVEDVIASYENGFVEEEFVEVEQTVIALGNVVFAAFPYELFSEIGLRIGGAIKNKAVLSLSNTNGSEGYFVTEDALCRGGYEVWMFSYGRIQPYCDNADFHIMTETVRHIREMK